MYTHFFETPGAFTSLQYRMTCNITSFRWNVSWCHIKSSCHNLIFQAVINFFTGMCSHILSKHNLQSKSVWSDFLHYCISAEVPHLLLTHSKYIRNWIWHCVYCRKRGLLTESNWNCWNIRWDCTVNSVTESHRLNNILPISIIIAVILSKNTFP